MTYRPKSNGPLYAGSPGSPLMGETVWIRRSGKDKCNEIERTMRFERRRKVGAMPWMAS